MRLRHLGLAFIVLGCGRSAPSPVVESSTRLAPFPAFAAAASRALPLVVSANGVAVSGARWRGPLDVSLPNQADGATRIAVGQGAWISVRPLDTVARAMTLEGNTLVGRDVATATDLVHLVEPRRVEELRVLRDRTASPTVRERIELGPAFAQVRLGARNVVEIVDAAGVVRVVSEPVVAIDAKGVERALALSLDPEERGATLVAKLDTAGLTYPIAIDPAWTPTASKMNAPHTSTKSFTLPTGKVLVVGNDTKPELYDPSIGYWFPAGTTAYTYRVNGPSYPYPAAQLTNGNVLLAGAGGAFYYSTAEVYDYKTNAWSAAASLSTARGGNTVTALPSGKALVTGGFAGGGAYFSSTELYDPSANTWTPGATMVIARRDAGAVAFPDGKVLVVGGSNGLAGTLSTTEIYDPGTNAWSLTGSLGAPRSFPRTVLLPTGKVIVFGGQLSSGSGATTAEIYDPATSTWTPSSSPGPSFSSAGQVLLKSGKLLVMAMPQPGASYPYTSLYDAATDTWTRTADMPGANVQGSWPALLADGSAVAPTGYDDVAAVFTEGVAVGLTCKNDSDCASNFCADGVCCNRACTASCEACNESGTVGTCVVVSGKPRGARAGCPGSGACGATCDGTSTSCTYPGASTLCVSPSCTAGTAIPATGCNGAGSCPAATPIVCGLYACGAVGCKTTCAVDSDCASTAFCDTTTNSCVAKKSSGGACSAASNCKPASDGFGHCESGVCCDRACDGVCEACNLSGSVGVCSARNATTVCGAATCASGTLTPAGHCSGSDGTCVSGAPAACPGFFACESGTACKTTCAGDADCAAGHGCVSGACVALADAGADAATTDGSIADSSTTDSASPEDTSVGETSATDTSTPNGQPDPEKVPRVSGNFQPCGADGECATGFCVDGVCCDQRCNGTCMTCVLPSSPGKCVAAPFGNDLRHECGPDLSCIGTCDGKGACTGAGPGTMCGRNVCTGRTTGVGPAYCTGKGDKCPVEEVFPFDCAPYTCEGTFGACRTTCQSSEHCGPGYLCDLTSARCINGSEAPADDSGCALSQRSGRGGATAFLAGLVACAIATRRRRARA